ncbi:MAG: sulfite exporter TauE/SafE family protein [Candidatus Omnitrophica bacterium]|nr:sulfite exporter TauE/SafE family protein [Candidatus Omnitrophota bacterium]
MQIFLYVMIGLVSGFLGGMLGLGGGAIMIPAMILMFGLTQHQAQGTSLAAMLPPVMILAVLRYYHAGNVKIQMACYIALGFVLGGFIGAIFAENIPDLQLKKIFGLFLVFVGIKIAFFK